MPRYFFHLSNRVVEARDREGREFDDLEAAEAAALEDVRSILSDEIRHGRIDLAGHIDIADGAGAVLATVRFLDAVELKLPGDGG